MKERKGCSQKDEKTAQYVPNQADCGSVFAARQPSLFQPSTLYQSGSLWVTPICGPMGRRYWMLKGKRTARREIKHQSVDTTIMTLSVDPTHSHAPALFPFLGFRHTVSECSSSAGGQARQSSAPSPIHLRATCTLLLGIVAGEERCILGAWGSGDATSPVAVVCRLAPRIRILLAQPLAAGCGDCLVPSEPKSVRTDTSLERRGHLPCLSLRERGDEGTTLCRQTALPSRG